LEHGNKPNFQRSHWYPAELGRGIKVESRIWVTSQIPKAGQVVDPEANLWDRRQHSKPNFPTLMGDTK
jgi:hypothetical protein